MPEHNAKMVYKMFAELGNTSEKIAQTLRDKKIKGRPKSVDCCPVANYLVEVCDVASASIGKAAIVRFPEGDGLKEVVVMLPYVTRCLIACFDEGLYPDLIEPIPVDAARDW